MSWWMITTLMPHLTARGRCANERCWYHRGLADFGVRGKVTTGPVVGLRIPARRDDVEVQRKHPVAESARWRAIVVRHNQRCGARCGRLASGTGEETRKPQGGCRGHTYSQAATRTRNTGMITTGSDGERRSASKAGNFDRKFAARAALLPTAPRHHFGHRLLRRRWRNGPQRLVRPRQGVRVQLTQARRVHTHLAG